MAFTDPDEGASGGEQKGGSDTGAAARVGGGPKGGRPGSGGRKPMSLEDMMKKGQKELKAERRGKARAEVKEQKASAKITKTADKAKQAREDIAAAEIVNAPKIDKSLQKQGQRYRRYGSAGGRIVHGARKALPGVAFVVGLDAATGFNTAKLLGETGKSIGEEFEQGASWVGQQFKDIYHTLNPFD